MLAWDGHEMNKNEDGENNYEINNVDGMHVYGTV